MNKLYTVLITAFLISSHSVSLAADDFRTSIKTRDNKDLILKMCHQAKDVLGKIRAIDASVSLDLACEVEEDFVTKSFAGFSNTIEYYKVSGQLSGDITRSCQKSDTYKIIRTDLISTHYSSNTGMPSGTNPFLKAMLNKLGVDFELMLQSTDYKHQAPLEVMILYPSC